MTENNQDNDKNIFVQFLECYKRNAFCTLIRQPAGFIYLIIINVFFLCGCNSIDNNKLVQRNNNIEEYCSKYNNAKINSFIDIGKMHNKSASLKLLLLNDNNVIISGGSTVQEINNFEIFNPQDGQYKIITLPAKFKQSRNSMIIDEDNILINDAFIYNYKTGKYTNIFNKDDYTNYSTSFLYSECEIFILEKDEKCYLYNFDNNSLKEVRIKFPFNLAGKNFIKIDKENILVYGTQVVKNKPGAYYKTHLYLWNIKNNAFKQLNPNDISTGVSIVKLDNNEIIIFCEKFYNQDENNIGKKEQETYKLNVKTNKLVKIKNSIIDRKSSPIATMLSNNKIFLIGGESNTENGEMIAELYDIAENKYFKLSATMSTYIPANPFLRPAILELSNKDILLCGGVYESNIQDKCLIYKMEK